MYNPLEKSQIGATAVTVGTGYLAAQNGATGWEALNVGLWWRWWYKNVTFSFFLTAVVFVVASQEEGALIWTFFAQCLVNTFVFSVTYVSLVDVSGFKHRLWYRLWAPVQHAMPNVARFYWYCLLFLPLWLAMWQVILFHANAVGPWWFGDAPSAPDNTYLPPTWQWPGQS